jgi:hypothetical protein
VQVPAIHIQRGNVGAELNATIIFPRARVASDVAGDRSAETYVPRRCGCVVSEVSANAAPPYAAALLVGLRIGRASDERTRLSEEYRVDGIDRRNKSANRRRNVRHSHSRCLSDDRTQRRCIQPDWSALSLGSRARKQRDRKGAGPQDCGLRPCAEGQYLRANASERLPPDFAEQCRSPPPQYLATIITQLRHVSNALRVMDRANAYRVCSFCNKEPRTVTASSNSTIEDKTDQS